MNNNLKKNMNLLVNPALDIKDNSPMELLGILLLLIVCTLPAVVISVRCNPKSPILMGIVAFLFDRIYLLQHVIRKYMLKKKDIVRILLKTYFSRLLKMCIQCH